MQSETVASESVAGKKSPVPAEAPQFPQWPGVKQTDRLHRENTTSAHNGLVCKST